MYDVPEILIFAGLGLLFAAGVAILARWSRKGAPRVAAYALIAVSFLYVGFALRSDNPGVWIGVEMTGVAIFGTLALLAIMGSPWFVVIGLAAQALWAIEFHYIGTGSAFTPGPVALANAGFDAALALYVAFIGWRGAGAKKATTAAAPGTTKTALRQQKDRVQ
jgi:hypothetical protein